jgi:hypothetical protein
MKKVLAFFVGCLALGMISSCSNSDDVNVNNGGTTIPTTKTLTLNISGSNPASRIAGIPSVQDEATINNLMVVIIDNDTHVIEKIQKFGNGTLTQTVKYATEKPSVVVLANFPDAFYQDVAPNASTMTLEQLKAKTLDIENTVIAENGPQVATNLPMIGSTAALEQALDGNQQAIANAYTADVVLHRMVARVNLAGVISNLPAGDTFVPEAVFIKNGYTVSNIASSHIAALDGEKSSWFNLDGFPTLSVFKNGFFENNRNADPEPTHNDIAGYFKNAYEASGDGAFVFGEQDQTQASFYIYPNHNIDFVERTQLVIKGKYTPNGGEAEDSYYVVVINREPGADVTYGVSGDENGIGDAVRGTGNIEANYIYNISATITGKGQNEEDFNNNEDPKGKYGLTVNITVQNWLTTINQAVTF